MDRTPGILKKIDNYDLYGYIYFNISTLRDNDIRFLNEMKTMIAKMELSAPGAIRVKNSYDTKVVLLNQEYDVIHDNQAYRVEVSIPRSFFKIFNTDCLNKIEETCASFDVEYTLVFDFTDEDKNTPYRLIKKSEEDKYKIYKGRLIPSFVKNDLVGVI